MITTNHHTIRLLRLPSLACALLLIALAGCNDDRSPLAAADLPGKPVEITVSVSGIESFVYTDEPATRSPLAPAANVRTLHTQVQPLSDGRLLITTLHATESAGTATRADTSLPEGTNFCVAAFDALGRFVDDCRFIVKSSGINNVEPLPGESLVVPVSAIPYTFYCYLPGMCLLDTGNWQEVVVGDNDEFAFAQTTKMVESGPSDWIVIPALKFKVAKVKLAVTSYDNRTVACRGKLTAAFADNTAFSLATGFFSATMIGRSKYFDRNNAEITAPISSAAGTDMDATLTLTDVSVGGMPVNTPDIKLPLQILSAGVRYTLAVELYRPSGLRYVEVPGAGLKVAKGNLMRFNGTGYWYLAPDQGYYTSSDKGGDYFCWGIDNPTTANSETATGMDALNRGCAAVLGAGWRVPTWDELTKLSGSGNVWGTYTSRGGAKNGRYFGTTAIPASQDDYLFLPASGYRNGGIQSVPYCGYYWSSTLDGSGYPISLEFTNSDCGNLFNMSKGNGLTIRCVAPLD